MVKEGDRLKSDGECRKSAGAMICGAWGMARAGDSMLLLLLP